MFQRGVHIYQTFCSGGSKYFDIIWTRGTKMWGSKFFVTSQFHKIVHQLAPPHNHLVHHISYQHSILPDSFINISLSSLSAPLLCIRKVPFPGEWNNLPDNILEEQSTEIFINHCTLSSNDEQFYVCMFLLMFFIYLRVNYQLCCCCVLLIVPRDLNNEHADAEIY